MVLEEGRQTHRVPLERIKRAHWMASTVRASGSLFTGVLNANPWLSLQQIDAIAKEKGVEPEIIISAVQDALEAAARKQYKGEEPARPLQPRDREIDLFTVKQIVDEVTDPATQFSLTEAQQLYGDEAEVDMEIEFPRRPRTSAASRRRPPSRSSSRRSARRSARTSTPSTASGSAKCVNGIVKRFENGDIIVELNAASRRSCRARSSRARKTTTSATASAPSSAA